MPWSAAFEDPIALPRGRALVTLEDAARYVQKLPLVEQAKLHWQTATSILIGAAEDREPLMHARIAVLRALNRDRPATPPEPRRKATKAYRIIG